MLTDSLARIAAYLKIRGDLNTSGLDHIHGYGGKTPLLASDLAALRAAVPVWFPAATLPPNSDAVLVELAPRRKGGKRRFCVGAYFRTKKGEHDGEPDWFAVDGDEIDVLRWQFIVPA